MYSTVTPTEAKRLIDEEGYTYLDVRTVEEFEASHADGAANIPVVFAGMAPNPNFLPVVQANYPTDARLVVACRSGGRSARAADILTRAGYESVANMDGGFHGRYDPMGSLVQAGWAQEQLPVSTESAEGTTYASLAARRNA